MAVFTYKILGPGVSLHLVQVANHLFFLNQDESLISGVGVQSLAARKKASKLHQTANTRSLQAFGVLSTFRRKTASTRQEYSFFCVVL